MCSTNVLSFVTTQSQERWDLLRLPQISKHRKLGRSFKSAKRDNDKKKQEGIQLIEKDKENEIRNRRKKSKWSNSKESVSEDTTKDKRKKNRRKRKSSRSNKRKRKMSKSLGGPIPLFSKNQDRNSNRAFQEHTKRDVKLRKVLYSNRPKKNK